MKPKFKGMDHAVEATFTRHLRSLLPLRNPSMQQKQNLVMEYCMDNLRTPRTKDAAGNIYSGGESLRGVVAHTDSVSQGRGKDHEAVVFDGVTWASKRGLRPIGGDDKVGVAVAMTIGEHCPYVSVILPADEESGCVGSTRMDFPRHELLIQNDRKGAHDLVHSVYGEIASYEAVKEATRLLPHRKPVHGLMTDVGEFAVNKLCANAFNLSCGYFDPHTASEFILHKYAVAALVDTWKLLHQFPEGVKEAESDYGFYDYYGFRDLDGDDKAWASKKGDVNIFGEWVPDGTEWESWGIFDYHEGESVCEYQERTGNADHVQPLDLSKWRESEGD